MPQLTEVLCHFPWRQWCGEHFNNRQGSRAVLQGTAMIRDARSFAATATQLVHRINVLYLPQPKLKQALSHSREIMVSLSWYTESTNL